jgi:regulator of protease activity HflC (stomatin/prohibitin superfamily)
MYKGRINSIVNKITGFADMIQLTHLKLQQVIARMVPDGVFLDMDGLAEVDLGNGTNYNPAEALNMYFQTGSIVGRSLTQEGDMNPGKVPIQELQTSSGGQKIASLIQTYQYYLQMIRDVTGLNEARDGSVPDKNTLVGLQKMAANASNVATKHVLNASLWLTLRTCENITLKIADSLKYPLTLNSLKSSISTYNVGTLAEIQNLNQHDFGIYLKLEPEEEEKQMLEQNIQMALQQNSIDLEDAIDIRQVKNLKLANDVLKQKRKTRAKEQQAQQQQMMQAQEQAKAQAAQATAQAEMQKQQALASSTVQIEQAKNQMEIQRLQTQAQLKKEEMQIQHQFDLELKRMEVEAMQAKEAAIEDRKDKRTKIEGSQQSAMIDQRNNDLMPINFEKQGPGSQPGI